MAQQYDPAVWVKLVVSLGYEDDHLRHYVQAEEAKLQQREQMAEVREREAQECEDHEKERQREHEIEKLREEAYDLGITCATGPGGLLAEGSSCAYNASATTTALEVQR